jgi:hypothetical protein
LYKGTEYTGRLRYRGFTAQEKVMPFNVWEGEGGRGSEREGGGEIEGGKIRNYEQKRRVGISKPMFFSQSHSVSQYSIF